MDHRHQDNPPPNDVDEIKRITATELRMSRAKDLAKLVIAMRTANMLPIEGPIRGLTATAELEGRPYDVSSLAVTLQLPRTTVLRHLEEMKDRGVVAMSREGRRTLVRLTDAGWREFASKWRHIDSLLDEFVMRQIKCMNERDSLDV